MTNGVAMPSFKPLSMLSARLIRNGTAELVTTAMPSAASVGARMAAMSAASDQEIDGNTTRAASAPSAMVKGSPMPRSRNGSPTSPSA